MTMDALHTFLLAAQRVRAHIDRAMAQVKRDDFQLTYQRYLVLDHVQRRPGCSRTDLANALGTPQANLKDSIAALVKFGFLYEQAREGYRVKSVLAVSPEGSDLRAEGVDALYEASIAFEAALEPPQREAIRAASEALMKAC